MDRCVALSAARELIETEHHLSLAVLDLDHLAEAETDTYVRADLRQDAEAGRQIQLQVRNIERVFLRLKRKGKGARNHE